MKDKFVEEVARLNNDGNGQSVSEGRRGKSFQYHNVGSASSSRNARRRKSNWRNRGG
jgi:hypothetical protein